jgi:hypothetical protein
MDDLWLFRQLERIRKSIEELQRLGPPRVFENIVTTLNNTPTLIYTFGTASDVVYQFRVTIVACRTDVRGETASYERTVHAKNIGGTVTIGATDSISTFEDTAAWAVGFSVSGTSILAQVTGENAKTINWKLRAYLDQHT